MSDQRIQLHDITADLALLVFSGPAEGSRDAG
jgi:hypothetical protein